MGGPPLGYVIFSVMDQSPTALFDSYESDFQQVSESIRVKLEEEAKNPEGKGLASAIIGALDVQVDQ